MAKFNWEKTHKETKKYYPSLKSRILTRKIKRAESPLSFKEKMDEALKKYGWQKCPKCSNGRHPMFPTCSKCRKKSNLLKKPKTQFEKIKIAETVLSKGTKSWQKKEQKDADLFHGKRTPRSGGLWNIPGDVKSDKFLIDSKDTSKNSFSINKKMWDKISGEAIKSRKIPLLSISIINNVNLIVLDRNDFIELLEK